MKPLHRLMSSIPPDRALARLILVVLPVIVAAAPRVPAADQATDLETVASARGGTFGERHP